MLENGGTLHARTWSTMDDYMDFWIPGLDSRIQGHWIQVPGVLMDTTKSIIEVGILVAKLS